MAVKAQYNPSTGLMAFNPDTGLVQVDAPPVPACSVCVGGGPGFIEVTFSDVDITDGCSGICPIGVDVSFENIPDINTTFTVPYVSACGWVLDVPVAATLKLYNSTDGSCTSLQTTINYTNLRIAVSKRVSTSLVTVFAQLQGPGNNDMFRSGDLTPTNCLTVSGPNIDRPTTDPECKPADGGSVTVVEI